MLTQFQDLTTLLKAGYTDLGYMNAWEVLNRYPALYLMCKEEKHEVETVSFSQHDNLEVCSKCKIMWHFDCSD